MAPFYHTLGLPSIHPDHRIVVVKGYMESLGAQFGSGSIISAEGDEGEESYLAVICYQLEG